MAVSYGGSQLAVACHDGGIRIFEIEEDSEVGTGVNFKKLLTPHPGAISSPLPRSLQPPPSLHPLPLRPHPLPPNPPLHSLHPLLSASPPLVFSHPRTCPNAVFFRRTSSQCVLVPRRQEHHLRGQQGLRAGVERQERRQRLPDDLHQRERWDFRAKVRLPRLGPDCPSRPDHLCRGQQGQDPRHRRRNGDGGQEVRVPSWSRRAGAGV
eukprot:766420-Hanusia_phi.AAC.2